MIGTNMTLDRLWNFSLGLSTSLEGLSVDWHRKEGSLAFAKLSLGTLTLLKNCPKSAYYTKPRDFDAWDISSSASICRGLVEAYLALFYIAVEKVTPDEAEFRKLIWEYHFTCESLSMLQSSVPESTGITNIERDLVTRQKSLQDNPTLLSLPLKRQKELLKGKDCMLLSYSDLCARAKISRNYFKTTYKYLSNHAHTTPYALQQFDLASIKSRNAVQSFEYIETIASQFLALGIRDYSELFPQCNSVIPDDIKKYIEIVSSTLEWEESPYYLPLNSTEKDL